MRKSNSIFYSFLFTYKQTLLFDLEKKSSFFLYLWSTRARPPIKIIIFTISQEKLFVNLFNINISLLYNQLRDLHVTSYLSIHAEHPSLVGQLVVN